MWYAFIVTLTLNSSRTFRTVREQLYAYCTKQGTVMYAICTRTSTYMYAYKTCCFELEMFFSYSERRCLI